MTYTGTLIEDLMATVECVERRAQSAGSLVAEAAMGGASLEEGWFVSAPPNTEYESKLLGVA